MARRKATAPRRNQGPEARPPEASPSGAGAVLERALDAANLLLQSRQVEEPSALPQSSPPTSPRAAPRRRRRLKRPATAEADATAEETGVGGRPSLPRPAKRRSRPSSGPPAWALPALPSESHFVFAEFSCVQLLGPWADWEGWDEEGIEDGAQAGPAAARQPGEFPFGSHFALIPSGIRPEVAGPDSSGETDKAPFDAVLLSPVTPSELASTRPPMDELIEAAAALYLNQPLPRPVLRLEVLAHYREDDQRKSLLEDARIALSSRRVGLRLVPLNRADAPDTAAGGGRAGTSGATLALDPECDDPLLRRCDVDVGLGAPAGHTRSVALAVSLRAFLALAPLGVASVAAEATEWTRRPHQLPFLRLLDRMRPELGLLADIEYAREEGGEKTNDKAREDASCEAGVKGEETASREKAFENASREAFDAEDSKGVCALENPKRRALESPHDVGHASSPKGLHECGDGSTPDVSELLAMFEPSGREAELAFDPPGLVATLRPYQRRAVRWMLDREACGGSGSKPTGTGEASELGSRDTRSHLHPLWRRVPCLEVDHPRVPASQPSPSVSFFVNPWTGQPSLQRFSAASPVRGGILAEEMGLGKTVELLACVLADRELERRARGELQTGTERATLDLERAHPRRVRESSPAAPQRTADSLEGAAVASQALDAGSTSTAAAPSASQRSSLDPSSPSVHPSSTPSPTPPRTAPGPSSAPKALLLPDVVRCPCGATSEGIFRGLWVACDVCGGWMHGRCAGVRGRAGVPPGARVVCPWCQAAHAEREVSGETQTTLIVCPASILDQWTREIERHVEAGTLKVLVYEGQTQPGVGNCVVYNQGHEHSDLGARTEVSAAPSRGVPARVTTAEDLAACDLVLTTYDVLRRDVSARPGEAPDRGGGNRSGDPAATLGGAAATSSRRLKRYPVAPTPLTRLVWRRTVLDEAQMVEDGAAAAARLARLLRSRTRWCVTGTPASRGPDDLQGLFAFLRLDPWQLRVAWRAAVAAPWESGDPAAVAGAKGRLQEVLCGNAEDWSATPVDGRSAESCGKCGNEDATSASLCGVKSEPVDARGTSQISSTLPSTRLVPDPRDGKGAFAPATAAHPPLRLTWRSSKSLLSRLGDLTLPPQQHVSVVLWDSAIERHFRARLHADALAKCRAAMPRGLLDRALRTELDAQMRPRREGEETPLGETLAAVPNYPQHPQPPRAAGRTLGRADGGAPTGAPVGIQGDDVSRRMRPESGSHAMGDAEPSPPPSEDLRRSPLHALLPLARPAHRRGQASPHGSLDPLDARLTPSQEHRVLRPLLRLRQSCVHPQVGAGGLKALAAMAAPMTMREVLATMVTKQRLEAEDAQRLLCAAENGLSGLDMIEGLYANAKQRYVALLERSKANATEHGVATDSLQVLHAIRNLLEAADAEQRRATQSNKEGKADPEAAAKGEETGAKAPAAVSAVETIEISQDSPQMPPAETPLEPPRGAAAQAPPLSPAGESSSTSPGNLADASRVASATTTPSPSSPPALSACDRAALEAEASEIEDAYVAESVAGLAEAASECRRAREKQAKALHDVARKLRAQSRESPVGSADGGSRLPPSDVLAGLPSETRSLLRAWPLEAARLLTTFGPRGGEAALEEIKGALLSEEAYVRAASRNAVGLARRFRRLDGLAALLSSADQELFRDQAASLKELDRLQALVSSSAVPASLARSAGSCPLCRAETAEPGASPCAHCRLDEKLVAWEVRAFASSAVAHTRAGTGCAGADDVARAALAAQRARVAVVARGGAVLRPAMAPSVGRGDGRATSPSSAGPSTDHDAALAAALAADSKQSGPKRGEDPVARAEVRRAPAEVEVAERMLLHCLNRLATHELRALSAADRDRLESARVAGAAALAARAASRTLHTRATALSLAQRARLYAQDELGMCAGRVRQVTELEWQGLTEAARVATVRAWERDVRRAELTADASEAKTQLREAVGVLRYLNGLVERNYGGGRGKGSGGAAKGSVPQTSSASSRSSAPGRETCPVCREPLPREFCLLSCGHALCEACEAALRARSRSSGSRSLLCPTCRAPVGPGDVTRVVRDGNEEAEGDGDEVDSAKLLPADAATWSDPDGGAEAMKKPVKGSYGTKVRHRGGARMRGADRRGGSCFSRVSGVVRTLRVASLWSF